jgi:hypothetical protein
MQRGRGRSARSIWCGAPGRTRTSSPLPATDFESAASTNSATGAPARIYDAAAARSSSPGRRPPQRRGGGAVRRLATARFVAANVQASAKLDASCATRAVAKRLTRTAQWPSRRGPSRASGSVGTAPGAAGCGACGLCVRARRSAVGAGERTHLEHHAVGAGHLDRPARRQVRPGHRPAGVAEPDPTTTIGDRLGQDGLAADVLVAAPIEVRLIAVRRMCGPPAPPAEHARDREAGEQQDLEIGADPRHSQSRQPTRPAAIPSHRNTKPGRNASTIASAPPSAHQCQYSTGPSSGITAARSRSPHRSAGRTPRARSRRCRRASRAARSPRAAGTPPSGSARRRSARTPRRISGRRSS